MSWKVLSQDGFDLDAEVYQLDQFDELNLAVAFAEKTYREIQQQQPDERSGGVTPWSCQTRVFIEDPSGKRLRYPRKEGKPLRYIIDEKGKPQPIARSWCDESNIDIERWAEWMAENDHKRILRTTVISEDIRIVSVFFGFDSLLAAGCDDVDAKPVLFGTRVFHPAGNKEHVHTTAEEALTYHQTEAEWLAKVNERLKGDTDAL